VWFGALTTAVFFVVGKSLFGLYLGHTSIRVSYGAAGSLVIVILWTYYPCLILLFGAEITQVQAELRHASVVPNQTAMHVTEHERAQQGIPRTEDIERARTTPERGQIELHLPKANRRRRIVYFGLHGRR